MKPDPKYVYIVEVGIACLNGLDPLGSTHGDHESLRIARQISRCSRRSNDSENWRLIGFNLHVHGLTSDSPRSLVHTNEGIFDNTRSWKCLRQFKRGLEGESRIVAIWRRIRATVSRARRACRLTCWHQLPVEAFHHKNKVSSPVGETQASRQGTSA